MVRALLIRGMLVGVAAGLLAFAFARLYGEPRVDLAIAFEDAMHAAAHDPPEMELVSRPVQASIGLFTGVVAYGAAFGGLFALVFGFAYGRVGRIGPRGLAALIAAIAFVALVIVPALKYPANPPSIGNPDTIGIRTWLFLGMLLLSLVAVGAAASARHWLLPRLGGWNASLAAGGVFILIVGIAMAVLPGVNEVPEGFPAAVLWQFRTASLGIQAILWSVIGLGFGLLTERRWPNARIR